MTRHSYPKPNEFPITGEHNGHNVRAAGVQRMDGEGKPLPTAHGIHGTNTAVDWDACSADGVCMDVCPVFVYEWALNSGQSGSGKDMILAPNSPDWQAWRSDKSDPVREKDCIYCMACETSLSDTVHQDNAAVAELVNRHPIAAKFQSSPIRS